MAEWIKERWPSGWKKEEQRDIDEIQGEKATEEEDKKRQSEVWINEEMKDNCGRKVKMIEKKKERRKRKREMIVQWLSS